MDKTIFWSYDDDDQTVSIVLRNETFKVENVESVEVTERGDVYINAEKRFVASAGAWRFLKEL